MNREEKLVRDYKLMFCEYDEVITPEQIQKMLGIGRRKTYELLKSGEIHSIRMGRIYRIPKISVIEYLCK